jgi:hypothetical protein
LRPGRCARRAGRPARRSCAGCLGGAARGGIAHSRRPLQQPLLRGRGRRLRHHGELCGGAKLASRLNDPATERRDHGYPWSRFSMSFIQGQRRANPDRLKCSPRVGTLVRAGVFGSAEVTRLVDLPGRTLALQSAWPPSRASSCGRARWRLPFSRSRSRPRRVTATRPGRSWCCHPITRIRYQLPALW